VGYQDRGVFAVPYAHIVGWLHVLLLAVLVFIFAGNRKVGIWLEIVILGESALLYPAFSYILSAAINSLQSRLGADMIITQSSVNALCSWVNMLFGMGSALLPVICGMSIAYKLMKKKMESYEKLM